MKQSTSINKAARERRNNVAESALAAVDALTCEEKKMLKRECRKMKKSLTLANQTAFKKLVKEYGITSAQFACWFKVYCQI